MLNKIIKRLIQFFRFTVDFNLLIAFKLVVLPYLPSNKTMYVRNAYKHRTVKKYLKRKFRKTINAFKAKHNEVDPPFADNCPVWFQWWNGEDAMPPIVKACYRALLENANGHKVNLVTGKNFRNYVSLPDFVLEKIERKQLSLTHLSDIMRMSLLYENGGLWLDSTVLLTEPLPRLPEICKSLGFWTPKDDGEIIKTCFGAENWIIRENKWLSFCLYSSRHNVLPEFVRALYLAYIKTNKVLIDYFIVDYFISIAYDTLPGIRIMIDSVPDNNPKVHEFHHRLHPGYEFNQALFDDLCRSTCFHKLNWKEEYTQKTKTGKLTNYGYVLGKFPGP